MFCLKIRSYLSLKLAAGFHLSSSQLAVSNLQNFYPVKIFRVLMIPLEIWRAHNGKNCKCALLFSLLKFISLQNYYLVFFRQNCRTSTGSLVFVEDHSIMFTWVEFLTPETREAEGGESSQHVCFLLLKFT